jgi:hypothetical protein
MCQKIAKKVQIKAFNLDLKKQIQGYLQLKLPSGSSMGSLETSVCHEHATVVVASHDFMTEQIGERAPARRGSLCPAESPCATSRMLVIAP